MSPRLELRPSSPEDFEFVFRLNEKNFRPYVERTRGWDEEEERRAMRKLFRPGVDEIVVVDGEDAGVLGVDRDGTGIFLRHIELSPEFQGLGVGTALIEDLLREGRERNVPVSLRVTRENPALAFYRRLGFRVVRVSATKHEMSVEPG